MGLKRAPEGRPAGLADFIIGYEWRAAVPRSCHTNRQKPSPKPDTPQLIQLHQGHRSLAAAKYAKKKQRSCRSRKPYGASPRKRQQNSHPALKARNRAKVSAPEHEHEDD